MAYPIIRTGSEGPARPIIEVRFWLLEGNNDIYAHIYIYIYIYIIRRIMIIRLMIVTVAIMIIVIMVIAGTANY